MKLDKDFLLKTILILYSLSVVLELHFFYNSISTLIRCLLITIIFLVIFFKYSTKKERKYLYIYFCVYLIYMILHLLNLKDNSIIAEILYFYKMSMSILMLYIVVKLGIKLDNFYKTLIICLWMISGSIVICNLLKIGYSSYTYSSIDYNIFSWFTEDISSGFIGTKGYFHFANQIIAILVLYLPLFINYLKKNYNVFNIITLCTVLISLLMLGNRISTIVPVIILVMALIIHIFLILIKKDAFDLRFFISILTILILDVMLILSSPMVKRNEFYSSVMDGTAAFENGLGNGFIDEGTTKEEIDAFLEGRNINFLAWYYPFSHDREFWYSLLKYDDSILMDGRFIEIKVVQRLVELNDNMPYDMYLGIGYDKIIKVQNIEKDFVMQYYSIGIIGTIILLGVYIVLYLYLLLKIFINLEDKFTFDNLMILMGLGILLVAAYYAGNLLNTISLIIPLNFVYGIALNEVNTKKAKESRVLGFKVCNDSKEEILNKITKDLEKKKQNIIYNINPLIVMNFYKNEKVKNEFNKQSFNIPDGIGTVAALKMKDIDIKGRVAGIDLLEDLLHVADKNKYKVYLYGTKKDIIEKAAEKIKEANPKINIVGISDGYQDEEKVVKDIIKSKPDMLFIATGSPKQELFIINNKQKLKDIKLIMPVGGSFDVISGSVKRAPKVWERLHLEWLYRMLKEPKRIKSNLNLIKFVFLVVFKNIH